MRGHIKFCHVKNSKEVRHTPEKLSSLKSSLLDGAWLMTLFAASNMAGQSSVEIPHSLGNALEARSTSRQALSTEPLAQRLHAVHR